MPKYLFEVSYQPAAAKSLLEEGGTKRKNAAEEVIRSAGGKLEAFYFSFGAIDGFLIADFPDNISASAVALNVNASGAVKLTTHVLVTPEEVDQIGKKKVQYRPPGSN